MTHRPWAIAGRAVRALRALRLLAPALLLLLPAAAGAQAERTTDGRKHAVHTVQPGETLFALSRAYAVPVEELLKANPDAKDGLRIGQDLLIPLDAVVKKEARTAPGLLKDGELRHTVARKETLFGIARKYGLDINDLLERNPAIASGLREGIEVIIPVRASAASADPALRPAQPTHSITHVVQPGETLYSLGQRYGVGPEEIKRANEGLPGGLQAGTAIAIPQPGPPPQEEPAPPVPAPPGATLRIGFLLPFSTERNDSTLEASALAATGPRFHEASRMAAQFWCGARMALDSLAAQGLNAEVEVIDAGDDPRRWGKALKEPAIARLDLAIGPFHRAAIEMLARANPKLPIVCPVPQSNKVVLGLPNVSKAVPARTDLARHAARYVAARYARENIILLRTQLPADRDMQDLMATTLNAALANQPARLRDSVAVVKAGRQDLGDLPARLDASRLNVVVVPSEDVEFVSAAAAKLKALAEKNRILVVGPEAWLSMDPVDAATLQAIGFTFPASGFHDPEDPATVRFTAAFRERWHQDVDEYALLGHDVTLHFVRARMASGAEAGAAADEGLLQNGFRMGRTGPENGQRNEYAVMLRIKELRLQRAP